MGRWSHLFAAVKVLTDTGLPVAIHAIADGRDVAPTSAPAYFQALEAGLPAGARVATVTGRYFALDRDQRWDRVETAYRAMVLGGGATGSSPSQVIAKAYDAGVTDEFIPATVLEGLHRHERRATACFASISALIGRGRFWRPLPIPTLTPLTRGPRPDLTMLGMVSYSDRHDRYMDTAFPKRDLRNTLGEWVSKHGKTQFRLAETEKYPHVTFFLNGGVETPWPGEDRFMPPSPKVATYDLCPEMSAEAVTQRFVTAIEAGYDLIVTNYANPDMVGHTGDMAAAVAACEAVDRGLGRVTAALEQVGGVMIVTADHGNCEQMIDPETGGAHTAHTTNLVPVILFNAKGRLRDGRLADVAPTVLALMGLDGPPEMTGESLLQ